MWTPTYKSHRRRKSIKLDVLLGSDFSWNPCTDRSRLWSSVLRWTDLVVFSCWTLHETLSFLSHGFLVLLNNCRLVVFFLLGDFTASEFYVPTFRNTASSIFIGGVSRKKSTFVISFVRTLLLNWLNKYANFTLYLLANVFKPEVTHVLRSSYINSLHFVISYHINWKYKMDISLCVV
jgi:hypothetical protein